MASVALLINGLALTQGGSVADGAPGAPIPAMVVTPLEAIHVAEIHTGGVATAAVVAEPPQSTGDQSIYRIDIRRGDAELKVRVNAVHGRLVSIHRSRDGSEEELYRWPGIRVVAHRGGALLGPPENTLPAIERAIEVGADLIEIDIRETADGHLILMHDETVDRMTDGRGRVADLTIEQVRQLRVEPARQTAEAPESSMGLVQVPTLAEALEAMRGRIDADLDFKEGDLGRLLKVVRRARMERHSTFCGPFGAL